MVKGPRGEKRPADGNARAVMVARIAVGEIEEPVGKAPNRAKGGRKGAKARAARSEIARAAAAARWKKGR